MHSRKTEPYRRLRFVLGQHSRCFQPNLLKALYIRSQSISFRSRAIIRLLRQKAGSEALEKSKGITPHVRKRSQTIKKAVNTNLTLYLPPCVFRQNRTLLRYPPYRPVLNTNRFLWKKLSRIYRPSGAAIVNDSCTRASAINDSCTSLRL